VLLLCDRAVRKNTALTDLVQNQDLVDRIFEKLGSGDPPAIPFTALVDELLKIPELLEHDAAVRAAIKGLMTADMDKSGVDEHEFGEFLVDLCSEKLSVNIKLVLKRMLGEDAEE